MNRATAFLADAFAAALIIAAAATSLVALLDATHEQMKLIAVLELTIAMVLWLVARGFQKRHVELSACEDHEHEEPLE